MSQFPDDLDQRTYEADDDELDEIPALKALYRKGYLAGLEAAAKCAEEYAPECGYQPLSRPTDRAAMQAGDSIAVAIRAMKEGK